MKLYVRAPTPPRIRTLHSMRPLEPFLICDSMVRCCSVWMKLTQIEGHYSLHTVLKITVDPHGTLLFSTEKWLGAYKVIPVKLTQNHPLTLEELP